MISLDKLVTLAGTGASTAASATTALFGPVKPILESVPVYSTGLAPTSAAVREADLRGWVILLVAASPLVNSVLAYQHNIAVTLSYREATGAAVVFEPRGPRRRQRLP